jgi:very-short-patch-repair endonuclease
MPPKNLEKSCNVYAIIWSNKNDISPDLVFISSNKKFWFNCNVCSHEYEQTPANKTRGSGCPFCSNKKLCIDKYCSFCLPKSCNVYSNIWSPKNNKKSEEVAISSNKKYLFDCHKCDHNYEQTPNDKTRGKGCPYCINKTERKVADYLKEQKIKFKKEFKIDNKKRYDFYLPDFNLILEVDGDQHFRQVSNWKSCEYTIENDIQKMNTALENGFSVLRIYQPDIFNDIIDWKRFIKDNLYLRKISDITCKSSVAGIYNNHLEQIV